MSEILFNAPPTENDLESQVASLQTTLASLNQQVIILQEALQERDKRIKDLEVRLSECLLASQTTSVGPLNHDLSGAAEKPRRIDHTLTIVGLLINLYQLILPPGKDVAASINSE